jgi:hypothetical protein
MAAAIRERAERAERNEQYKEQHNESWKKE